MKKYIVLFCCLLLGSSLFALPKLKIMLPEAYNEINSSVLYEWNDDYYIVKSQTSPKSKEALQEDLFTVLLDGKNYDNDSETSYIRNSLLGAFYQNSEPWGCWAYLLYDYYIVFFDLTATKEKGFSFEQKSTYIFLSKEYLKSISPR